MNFLEEGEIRLIDDTQYVYLQLQMYPATQVLGAEPEKQNIQKYFILSYILYYTENIIYFEINVL